jgi:NTE family protein
MNMPAAALVLSGGGARGGLQVTAEKYVRQEVGFRWKVISGVSVGALNGAMLAMEKYQRLEQLWRSISQEQVYTGRWNPWSYIKLIFGAKSIYKIEPLWRLIEQEIDPAAITTDLRIGSVSLRTGRFHLFRPDDPGFKRAILASTIMPILWPPQEVSGSHREMVDGGLRHVSPLRGVLDAEPDQIVIIHCSPRRPSALREPLKNAVDIAKRALLDITVNELAVNDLEHFIAINELVRQASAQGITLFDRKGKPLRAYRYWIIEPEEALDDPLDFSADAIERSMRAGRERAQATLESNKEMKG